VEKLAFDIIEDMSCSSEVFAVPGGPTTIIDSPENSEKRVASISGIIASVYLSTRMFLMCAKRPVDFIVLNSTVGYLIPFSLGNHKEELKKRFRKEKGLEGSRILLNSQHSSVVLELRMHLSEHLKEG